MLGMGQPRLCLILCLNLIMFRLRIGQGIESLYADNKKKKDKKFKKYIMFLII